MDHYPEVNVSERECSSRRSNSSTSTSKSHQHLQSSTTDGQLAPPLYTSFPPPDNKSEQERLRTDSVHSTTSSEKSSQHIEKDLAQYTDAPPPYSEKQYEGKSEEQKHKMRMADYAKELKRMMGRQLVRGIRNGETKVQQ